jgi:uncharacterized protein (DUF305 family)
VTAEHEAPGASDDAAPRTTTATRAVVYGAAALTLLLVGATVGLLIGRSEMDRAVTSPGPVDVGFSQDMTVHHLQAVEMGNIARERGEDGAIRQLGFDIAHTQQGQVGRMQGWLTLWGEPEQAPGEVMTWMTDDDHHGCEEGDGRPQTVVATGAQRGKAEPGDTAHQPEASELAQASPAVGH